MSKGYIPTSQTNPCPACNNTSGKCRSKDDAGKTFFTCMNFADAKFGEVVNGLKCIAEARADKSYFGTTWTIDNSTERTEEQRREWEAKRERQRQAEVQAEAARQKRSLSPTERDINNRKLLEQLILEPADRADLERRGFTDEEIILFGAKSVEPDQVLKNPVSGLLPGTSRDGKRLHPREKGYLCPMPDINGLICGNQVRVAKSQDGNRYPWLNTKNQTIHLYPEGNEELPIAVYKPGGETSGVLLAEGTIKPFLASRRLNYAAIGAAGGMFPSSPNLLKDAIAKLQPRDNLVKIAVDGGDVINKSTILRWQKTCEMLTQWRYTPLILWWNQVTKDDCDIDELTDYSQIQEITPDEFFKLAEKAQAEAKKAEEERQQKLKEEAENALYTEFTSVREKPWLEVNQKELDIDEHIKAGAIYIILSAKGTGKTNSLKRISKSFNNIYAWFSRRALGNEECHRIGIDWDKKYLGFSRIIRVGFCADSSYKYDPAKLGKNGLLLIDEADQVFDHIFGDTCNKDGKRPMIQAHLEAHLEAALAGSGAAIFMSADITQRDIDYIKELAPPGVPVRLIVNHYKPEKGDCYFDTSDTPDGQIEQLLANLEEGKPTFVIDDIKDGLRGCKSIAEYVRTLHPEWADKIVEINSDTSTAPEIIAFLENINEASKDVLLICCSPSVISGISLENGRFNDSVFGFFNGILTVSQASQALSRVRGATAVNVWAAEEGLVWAANRATDPREISGYYQRNYERNSIYIQSFKPEYEPMSGEWTSPHWRLYCKNAAYRNLCMARLRERLKAKLSDEGYCIIECQNNGSDMVKKSLEQAWTKIELAEAEAVANAEFFTDEELEQIQYRDEGLKPEEKWRFEKTMLRKWFGEELIAATTFKHKETGKILTGYAAMYLKNERGVYKQKLENFYLLTSGIEEAIAQDFAREKRQLNHGFGRFAGDIRWRSRQVKCREHLGLKEFLKPNEWTTPNDYRELAQKAKSRAKQVKDVLGINVENIPSDSQIFTELISQLGLELDKQRVEGQKYKKRRIDEESWKFAQMYVEHKRSLKAEAEAKQADYEASKVKVSAPVAVGKLVAEVTEVVSLPEPVQLALSFEKLTEATEPEPPANAVQTEVIITNLEQSQWGDDAVVTAIVEVGIETVRDIVAAYSPPEKHCSLNEFVDRFEGHCWDVVKIIKDSFAADVEASDASYVEETLEIFVSNYKKIARPTVWNKLDRGEQEWLRRVMK